MDGRNGLITAAGTGQSSAGIEDHGMKSVFTQSVGMNHFISERLSQGLNPEERRKKRTGWWIQPKKNIHQ